MEPYGLKRHHISEMDVKTMETHLQVLDYIYIYLHYIYHYISCII